MTTLPSLIDHIEGALAREDVGRRAEMASRITELFVADAERYTDEQIELFDQVIVKLVETIEAKARAVLAARLARVRKAPLRVIRMLAFDDDIEVARPVLKGSDRLRDIDLIANAQSKSQLHLMAISERRLLSEALTDVLVTRGDHRVVQTVVRNAGARFSDGGFRLLVRRSTGDDALALQIGARRDIPRQHFLRLLEQASGSARLRLAAENPKAAALVEGIVIEVADGIQIDTRKSSFEYTQATVRIEQALAEGRLGELEVAEFARQGSFEDTVVALSKLIDIEIDAVERAFQDRGHEIVLIMCKIADFSSPATRMILRLKTSHRGIAAQDLDTAMRTFDKLQLDTARRVLSFYRTRIKARSAAPGELAAAG